MARFQGGVSKASVDAALVCLDSAVKSGSLSIQDIRYILDRVRRIIIPRKSSEALSA